MGSWVRAPAGSQVGRGVRDDSSFFSPTIMFVLYILYSQKLDRYYVGYTNNLGRRIQEHNRIKRKYTDIGIPWILVYSEDFADRKSAAGRERLIKSKKSKQYILDLIRGM
jgi:putative endonuclease